MDPETEEVSIEPCKVEFEVVEEGKQSDRADDPLNTPTHSPAVGDNRGDDDHDPD